MPWKTPAVGVCWSEPWLQAPPSGSLRRRRLCGGESCGEAWPCAWRRKGASGWRLAVGRALQAGAPPWFSTVPLVASAGPGARRHGLASCPARTLALKEVRPSNPKHRCLLLGGFWGQRLLPAPALFPWALEESPSWVWLLPGSKGNHHWPNQVAQWPQPPGMKR